MPRAVAAAETLAAAGRLDQAARITHDTLTQPLPPAAEARLRCVLSSVLCARGQARDAAAEARMVLAQPQLPDGLRDRAMTAHLQALAGLRAELATSLVGTVLAAPDRHDRQVVVAALVTRAIIARTGARSATGSNCCGTRPAPAAGSLPTPVRSSHCSCSPPR